VTWEACVCDRNQRRQQLLFVLKYPMATGQCVLARANRSALVFLHCKVQLKWVGHVNQSYYSINIHRYLTSTRPSGKRNLKSAIFAHKHEHFGHSCSTENYKYHTLTS